MNNKTKKLVNNFLRFSILALVGLAIFYLGILYSRGSEKGFPNLVKEQGINVFFGIIGGMITAALITMLRPYYNSIRHYGKGDTFLSDIWDETYVAEDFPEKKQAQDLCFDLKQTGEIISGKLFANDPKDLPKDEPHYGPRIFRLNGRKEGNFISLDAVLEFPENETGHTVYLLEINGDGSKLEGETLYFDLTHKVIASAKSTLLRHSRTRRK